VALPLNLSGALRAFSTPLPVQVSDIIGSYVDGVWQWGDEVLRPYGLNGVLLAMDAQTLSFYGEGDAARGGLVILTQDVLYFTNVTAQGTADKQSFVLYQDLRFRVVGTGMVCNPATLSGNANFSVFNCLRDIR
jgi:hypothetical protein